jgi:hypothetical protein
MPAPTDPNPIEPDPECQPSSSDGPAVPEVSRTADTSLDEQRLRHEGDTVDVDETGVGALVNNTGLDGGAATG